MENENNIILTETLQAEIHQYVLGLRKENPKIKFTKVKSMVKKKFGIIIE